MRKAFIRATASLAIIFSFSSAIAATDGTLGPTSTGTSVVTVTTGNVAMLTGMADFDFGVWVAAMGDVTMADNVCVYTNTAAASYTITPSSANSGGTGLFRMLNGGVNLTYAVGFTNATGSNFAGSTCGAAAGDPCVGSGTPSSVQTNADVAFTNCSDVGGSNATLSIQILGADLSAVPGGVYTDTLTIVVSPL
jgi:hypothetical protein